jgi:formylmethanofuran dehydrogenase subunit E
MPSSSRPSRRLQRQARLRAARTGETYTAAREALKRFAGMEILARKLHKARLIPLGVPGSLSDRAQFLCESCQQVSNSRYNAILYKGIACRQCLSRETVAKAPDILRAAGFVPAEPYPGANEPWACHCQACGTYLVIRYSRIREGRGCPACYQAKKELAKRGVA